MSVKLLSYVLYFIIKIKIYTDKKFLLILLLFKRETYVTSVHIFENIPNDLFLLNIFIEHITGIAMIKAGLTEGDTFLSMCVHSKQKIN